jgi:hypothetical protein
VAQPSGNPLAELGALLADHDGGATGEFVGPVRRRRIGAAHGARDQPRIGVEILLGSHIEKNRAMRRADEARELIDGDGVE